MVSKYVCPVCGFWMEDPACEYNICSCCGTEFGNHDLSASIIQLRASWLRNGALWWSRAEAPPNEWDPYMQVAAVPSDGSIRDRPFYVALPSQLPSRLLEMISDVPKPRETPRPVGTLTAQGFFAPGNHDSLQVIPRWN